MTFINIKSRIRSQKLDINGQVFLKGKLQFRFIRKWVSYYNTDIVKIKKIFPTTFTTFMQKQLGRRRRKLLKTFARYFKRRRGRFRRRNRRLYFTKQGRIPTCDDEYVFNLRKYRRFRNRRKLKKYLLIKQYRLRNKLRNHSKGFFNILDYDLDIEFIKYYSKFRYRNFINYRIRYDTFNKKLLFFKRLFLKKQRLKTFLNLKDFQFKHYIHKLKSNKFYLFDFMYLLEYRLDSLLYRIFFFHNYKVVKHFIKTYGVYVNGFIIKDYNYLLKVGDLVQLSKNLKALTQVFYLLNQVVLVPFPKYFEVNYNTLTIIIKSFFLFKNKLYNKKKIPKRDSIKNKLVVQKKPDLQRVHFFVKRFKKYHHIFNKKLYFTIVQKHSQLYYPFKFNVGDLNAIFQYY